MNNHNKSLFTNRVVIVYLLVTIICLALLQSLATPFAFMDEGIFHLQPYDTKGLIKGGIYFGIYLASLLAIALAIFTQNRLVATILVTFITLSYGIDLLIQFIGSNEKGISLGLFSLAMVEQSRVDDMILFKTQLYQSFAAMIAFIVVVVFSRIVLLKNFRVNTSLSVIIIFSVSLLAWASIYTIYSFVGQSYPAPIKSLAIALQYYQEDKNQEPRVLDKMIQPARKADYKTIVWIVDESVGGQYLSVNGFNEKTTPYLDKISNNSQDYFNYGVVPSIANCSAASNLLLRIGLTNKFDTVDIKKLKNTLPTIFQYARKAGFETSLIDAQVAKGQLQNHLSVTDQQDIDNYITFSRKHIPNQRDRLALKALEKLIDSKDEKLRFIVVVKWGAHWPYALTYRQEVFKPAAKDSYTEMTEENRELILNAYFNSLRYSVDEFLQLLTSFRPLDKQILFYTSDHGQSLYQNNDPLTHCHEGQDPPPMDEFKVPLMVFSKDIIKKITKPVSKKNTQEQLFPTTLSLMGYPKDIVSHYGPTLFEGSRSNNIKVNVGATNRRVNYVP